MAERLIPGWQITMEAREWIGTRVMHRQHRKGISTDCLGFVAGVGAETGAMDPLDWDSAWWRQYGHLPNPRIMERALQENVVYAGKKPAEGLIAWMCWRGSKLPMHLGIMATHEGRWTFIHAHALRRPPEVCEMGWSPDWEARTVGFWRYPRML